MNNLNEPNTEVSVVAEFNFDNHLSVSPKSSFHRVGSKFQIWQILDIDIDLQSFQIVFYLNSLKISKQHILKLIYQIQYPFVRI